MRIYFYIISVGIALAALLAYVGFVFYMPSRQTTQVVDHKIINVATSIYPFYYFVTEIGGPYVKVVNITPAGAEPHEYELTPNDIVSMQKADMVVVNGLHLESWLNDASLNPASTLVIGDVPSVSTMRLGSNVDPHIWLSPKLMAQAVTSIAHKLASIDPDNAAEYITRAYAVNEELHMLDEEFALGLKDCLSRDLVTSHAAFGYVTYAYGLKQISILGLSPEEEPSPRVLADIVELVRGRDVKTIFFESLVNPKLALTLAQEVGAKTLSLNSIESLTKEELVEGKTYISEMRNNLHNLQQGLSCHTQAQS